MIHFFVSAESWPGMLDNWVGPIERQDIDGDWRPAITTGRADNRRIEVVYLDTRDWGYIGSATARLDTRRPEVYDHLVRQLASIPGAMVESRAPIDALALAVLCRWVDEEDLEMQIKIQETP